MHRLRAVAAVAPPVEKAQAGELSGAVAVHVGHCDRGIEEEPATLLDEESVDRGLPEPISHRIGVHEQRASIVDHVVPWQVGALVRLERGRVPQVAKQEDRPAARVGTGVVVDRTADAREALEVGCEQGVDPARFRPAVDDRERYTRRRGAEDAVSPEVRHEGSGRSLDR